MDADSDFSDEDPFAEDEELTGLKNFQIGKDVDLHTSECQSFTSDGLIDIINSIADNAAEVLEIKPEICKLILPLYHWSSESLLDNGQQKEVPRETQHLDRLSAFPIQFDSRILWHLFWTVWDAVTRTAAAVGVIRDEAQWLFSCPNCELLINENVILCLVDDERILNTYRQLLINSYVSTNPRIKWCPATDCIFATEVPIAESCGVPCQCGNIFCFDCSSEWHQPAECLMIEKWTKETEEDIKSVEWKEKNSKPCPECKSPIEKNGGCNHIHCRNCNTHYCWLCNARPWKALHSCNAFNVAQPSAGDNNRFMNADRFTHYMDRYTNHRNSMVIQKELQIEILKRTENIRRYRECTQTETSFLQKAFDMLVKSRRTLMYSIIFEDNQGILEVSIELLSDLLERDLTYSCDKNYAEWRENVQNATSNVRNQRAHLIEHVEQGVENNELVTFR
ncbi:RBR-type E3 ubiquitin transferase [Aphelenchoides besseyi]|nr:RBR-type E3 ubiquitin transferase [Aphelenchoides besseyi]